MALLTSARSLRPADWVIMVVVLALFAGPGLVLVLAERPARFGFQMYSGYGEVEATWRDADGTEYPVDLTAYVASVRHEVDWTRRLPRELCQRLPEAVSVEVRQVRGDGSARGRSAC